MYYLGCDLGSTTGKAVVLKAEGERASIVGCAIMPSGPSPEQTAEESIMLALQRAGIERDKLVASCATGYGRENIASIPNNVSEISCHARGAHFQHPACRTIIDVGGQDVKAISISGRGKVLDFTMNDKCAAGTGKFFEAMARTLRVSVEELGQMALSSKNPVPISSTCSVFAESEVITAINKGLPRDDISGGIHESIARRLVGMVNRVGLVEDVVLTGGCAKNPGLRLFLERMLGMELSSLPCDPQINGALGAALFALDGSEVEEPRFSGDAPRMEPDHTICDGCAVG